MSAILRPQIAWRDNQHLQDEIATLRDPVSPPLLPSLRESKCYVIRLLRDSHRRQQTLERSGEKER